MIHSQPSGSTYRRPALTPQIIDDFKAAKANLNLLLEQDDSIQLGDLKYKNHVPEKNNKNEDKKDGVSLFSQERVKAANAKPVLPKIKLDRKILQKPFRNQEALTLLEENPFLTFKTLSQYSEAGLSPEGLRDLAQRTTANRLLHEKDRQALERKKIRQTQKWSRMAPEWLPSTPET